MIPRRRPDRKPDKEDILRFHLRFQFHHREPGDEMHDRLVQACRPFAFGVKAVIDRAMQAPTNLALAVWSPSWELPEAEYLIDLTHRDPKTSWSELRLLLRDNLAELFLPGLVKTLGVEVEPLAFRAIRYQPTDKSPYYQKLEQVQALL